MSSIRKNPTPRLPHSYAARADEKINSGEGSSHISWLSCQSYEVVINTTLSMLQKVGYHQLTIEGIATTAGVDTAAIYSRWSTKASLVIEVINRRLRQAPSMCGDPEKDIRAIVLNLIEVFNDTIPCGLPAFVGDLAHDPGAAETLATALGAYRPSNTAALREAVRPYQLPYDVDITDGLDIIAGTIFYRRLMHRPVDDTFVEQLTKLAATGELPRLNRPPQSA